MRPWVLRLGAIVLLSAAACRESREAPEPVVVASAAPVETGPLYSPFVVKMTSELPFEVISFKDVGMSVDPSARHLVYEEVAESLSVALASDVDLPMSSAVHYASEMSDAASHLACGAEHIYVDLWAPTGSERWGYSLWSGCSEEDRFAHQEVDRVGDADIDTLTRHIAVSLRRAVSTGCFLRRC